MKAISINNEKELYITILRQENLAFISKPFFDENKNVLGLF